MRHSGDIDAGTCPCVWCADLATIRAWVDETPFDEQRRLMSRAIVVACS